MTVPSSTIWRDAAVPSAQPRSAATLAEPAARSAGRAAAPRKKARPAHEPGLKRANFGDGPGLATLLLLPQFLILLFFFFIPSLRALTQSVLLADPFGTTVHFVWFDNFTALFASERIPPFAVGDVAVHGRAERHHPSGRAGAGLCHRPYRPRPFGLSHHHPAALCHRACDRRHPVGVPVQSGGRAARADAAFARHPLGPEPQPEPCADPGDASPPPGSTSATITSSWWWACSPCRCR